MPKNKKLCSSKRNCLIACKPSEENLQEAIPPTVNLENRILSSDSANISDFKNGRFVSRQSVTLNNKPQPEASGQHPLRGAHFHLRDNSDEHDSQRLSRKEFYNLVCSLPVVMAYQQAWGTKPAYMKHLCGINFEKLFCRFISAKAIHVFDASDCLHASKKFICQCLVPEGMPFAVDTSLKLGIVVLTPFYSVIPAFLIEIPSIMIALQKMNLSHVVNNPQFRHEFAFSRDLRIEVPREILDFSQAQTIWSTFSMELKSVIETPQARAPSAAIFQVIYWIRDLMLSVLPATLGSAIISNVDPIRFLSSVKCSEVSAACATTAFIGSMLESCIKPLRRGCILSIQASFEPGFRNLGLLVRGLKHTVSLLHLMKVDYLNARIMKSKDLLWENTGIIEKQFYSSQIRSGALNVEDFSKWLQDVPDLQESIPNSGPNHDSFRLQFRNDSRHRSRHLLCLFTAGFIASFLRFSSRKPVLAIFQLDKCRIVCLQSRFDSVVREYLDKALPRLTSFSGVSVTNLMKSPDFQSRKVYQVAESRILARVFHCVYTNLVKAFEFVPLDTPNKQQLSTSVQPFESEKPFFLILDQHLEHQLEELTLEMTLLLVLHLTSARHYYEQLFQNSEESKLASL